MFFTRETVAMDYDCDAAGRLKMSAAMKYMQQTSGEHLDLLGLPYQKLYEENMVFLLSKTCIKVLSMPVSGQKIILGTAPVATQGARFIREFVIDNAKGERMVSAFTMWLLVDPSTRRILRPANFPYEIPFQESAIDKNIKDIALPKSAPKKEDMVSEVAVKYSHIDCNNHVNNSMYADFVCDAVPMDKLLQKGLDTMVIRFHNEAKWGDILDIHTSVVASNEFYMRGQKGGDLCFEALATLKTEEIM